MSSLPPGPFDVIYADPPWRYEHSVSDSRAIENQYDTLTTEEICGIPVSSVAANDSVLFLWATAPKLVEALDVVNAWGFVYRTHMVWDKEIIGMGYWVRGRHELLLIAIRGTPRSPSVDARPDSIISVSRRNLNHSEKPQEFRDIIDKMTPWATRRIELFARGGRVSANGEWVGWGDEFVAQSSMSEVW